MNLTFGNRRISSLAFIVLCLTILTIIILLCSSGGLKPYRKNPSLNDHDEYHRTEASNTVFVYTGRWKYLQIQLPYLYRDLRKNGGVIDKVQFMMLQYESSTLDRLINFTNTANKILMEDAFSIHYMGYIPYAPPPKPVYGYHQALYEVIEDLIQNPTKRFFKLDDDVVYIHPKAFANMIDMKRSDCAIHYFNIAGSNWRCSWLHQKYGVFNGLNPKNLTFNYSPSAECGWESVECGNLTLQTFLHHYYQSHLEKYYFDIEYLTDRERFSINGYLIDKSTNLFEIKKWLLNSEYHSRSEESMLHKYFQHTPNPPCIVGRALIVHFAYRVITKKLCETDLLQQFHDLVKKSKDDFFIPLELWQVLNNDK